VDALGQHNRAFVASDRLSSALSLRLAGGAAFRIILKAVPAADGF
jgi:hypothetical protein